MPTELISTEFLQKTKHALHPPLISKKGTAYETKITLKTTVKKITKEGLLEELKKRELIKPSKEPSMSFVITDDNKFQLVGKEQSLKLTPRGHAYFETIHKPILISHENISYTFDPQHYSS